VVGYVHLVVWVIRRHAAFENHRGQVVALDRLPLLLVVRRGLEPTVGQRRGHRMPPYHHRWLWLLRWGSLLV